MLPKMPSKTPPIMTWKHSQRALLNKNTSNSCTPLSSSGSFNPKTPQLSRDVEADCQESKDTKAVRHWEMAWAPPNSCPRSFLSSCDRVLRGIFWLRLDRPCELAETHPTQSAWQEFGFFAWLGLKHRRTARSFSLMEICQRQNLVSDVLDRHWSRSIDSASIRCSHQTLVRVPVQFVQSNWRRGRVEREPGV